MYTYIYIGYTRFQLLCLFAAVSSGDRYILGALELNPMYRNREDASSMLKAGAVANTTEDNG